MIDRLCCLLLAVVTLSLSSSVPASDSGQDKNAAPAARRLVRQLVTLQAKRITLSQALVELTKQTGIRIEDVRGVADETIALDLRHATFWQALDTIAAAVKARVRLYPASGRIVLDKRGNNYRLPPIGYDGRFRLRVKKVTTSRNPEISDNDAHSGSTHVVVEAAWDPALLPLYLETRPHKVRLRIDNDTVQTLADEGSALAPVDGLIALDINLHLPALPRSVAVIRSLEGELSMIGPSKMLTFTFNRLDKLAQIKTSDPERQLTQQGVTCRILDVQLLRDRWTIRVALDYPPGMKQLDSNQSWVVNNEMTLESPDGNKRFASTHYVVESATSRRAILSYHFQDRDSLVRGKPDDWRVSYRTPANLVEVPIKFAFKDVPLP